MKKEFGLDVIRAIATFFIVAVHFYLNSTYYNVKMMGKTMLIITVFRWLFFICVPLFIILTGYLKANKKPNKEHYKGIKHILISYVFISIVVLLFRIFYLKNDISPLGFILSIFNFTGNNYSWYIEMYIGLFLLIPFLNILYKGCDTKKNKLILIFTILGISSLHSLINVFTFNKVAINIIPSWWANIYPLGYYFIGCFIREYKPKVKRLKTWFICGIICCFQALASYIFASKGVFSWSFMGEYNSIITVCLSTLVFLSLYDIKCNNNIIIKPIGLISNISLDIYLFSKISDNLIYPKLNKQFYSPTQYLKYIPLIIITSFTIAVILSLLKKLLFYIIHYIYRHIKRKA